MPAVKQGLIAEADIDRPSAACSLARFRLGMFDPPEMVQYAQIPYSVNDSAGAPRSWRSEPRASPSCC